MYRMERYDAIPASSVIELIRAGVNVYAWVQITDGKLFRRGIYNLTKSPGVWVVGCLTLLGENQVMYMIRKRVID